MPALATLLPFVPSSVFTIADETSFLELPSGDQCAATLLFLMALARTLSVQDHLAVLGSHDQKIPGEGRDLRRVGSPTSCSKSFVLHVTGYPWPFHGSERKLGKAWLCVSHPFPVPPTSSWAHGHGQQPCTCSSRLSISLDLQMQPLRNHEREVMPDMLILQSIWKSFCMKPMALSRI